MTIVKRKPLDTSVNPPEISAEKRIEAQRMQDVLLLLQNLVNSQEATVKLILDCLYDIGSVNLINQRVRFRHLNRLTKLIARMSKPVFRVYALRWFKKNCPQLIANWLHSQVAFATKAPEKKVAVQVSQIQPYSPSPTETLSREVKHLRSQVRLLTGVSILALAALGMTVTWVNISSELAPLQTKQQLKRRSQNTGVRNQNQLVGDLNPPVIENHQFSNSVGDLNPLIHPPVVQDCLQHGLVCDTDYVLHPTY
jgi:hypothetical protein